MNIASYIEHTLLKPDLLRPAIQKLCEEAIQYNFAAVCIPPPFVCEAKRKTESTTVKVSTVIGFPFGYSVIGAKLAEAVSAMADGADELDMVINIIALRNRDWQYLSREIYSVMPVVQENNKILKVIIETGILTEEEIIKCCTFYGGAKVDYVKTSTGYAEKNVTVGTVRLMRAHLPPSVRIKASGGIRNYDFAKQLIDAGADRLGSSSGIAILTGEAVGQQENY
jgi:deoxyribose-phosphate aldolase